MLCYSKLEHLFYRVYPALKNFPVAEKYVLCVHIKDCKQGVDGLGYRIFSTHILFKSRTKKKIIKILQNEDLELADKVKSISSFNSYLNLSNSHNFKEKQGIYDLLKPREV